MEPDQHLHLETSSEEEWKLVQETPNKKDRPQQEVHSQFIKLKSSDWDLSKMTPEEELQYNYPTISDPSLTAEDAYAARPWLSGIPDYENDDAETHSPVTKTAEKWVETYKRKDIE